MFTTLNLATLKLATVNLATLRFVLYHIRFIQVLVILAFGMTGFLFTKIPHSLWILFSVLAISSSFEPGLEVTTAMKRAKGSIAGLLLGTPLIYLCQFNYRLIPLGLIFAACCMWLPSRKNSHIMIIFFILLLFFMTSYSFTTPTPEGPFEFTVNRLVCELIGILICLGTDYIIFAKFNYSRKVYFLLQVEICKMFQDQLEKIIDHAKLQKNKYGLAYELQKGIDNLFFDIDKSGESVLHDLRTDQKCKEKIKEFSTILFKLHNKIFAIYYSTLILNEALELNQHIEDFQATLKEAKNCFIENI